MSTAVFYKNALLSCDEQALLFDGILECLPNKTFKDIVPLFDGYITPGELDSNSKIIYNPPYKFERMLGRTYIKLEFEDDNQYDIDYGYIFGEFIRKPCITEKENL